MSRLLKVTSLAALAAVGLLALAAGTDGSTPAEALGPAADGNWPASVVPPSPGAALPRPLPDAVQPGGTPVVSAALPSPVVEAPPPSPSGAGPLAAWGPPAAPGLDPRRFTEAHWQGLEVIPRTPVLAAALGLPPGVEGVIVDDVTLPADLQGFEAGDLVVAVGSRPTPDLTSFLRATDAARDGRRATITLVRDGERRDLMLQALGERLGNGNGETASMIPPGARMPHGYRGPCVECHRIGFTGTLPVDQGDLLTKTAPVIRAGAPAPHRDRGPCDTCHQVLP